MVDTGSNITIVRPDVVKDEILRNKISPVGSFLRTVTGERAPVIGRACLKFRLGGYETEQEIWLAELGLFLVGTAAFYSCILTGICIYLHARNYNSVFHNNISPF